MTRCIGADFAVKVSRAVSDFRACSGVPEARGGDCTQSATVLVLDLIA